MKGFDPKGMQGAVVAGWVDGNRTWEEAYARLNGAPVERSGKPASLALIAATLNYGRHGGVTASGRRYPPIPPRPFMDLAMERLRKKLPRIVSAAVQDYVAGRIARRGMLEKVGSYAAGEIRAAITDGNWQGLAEATKRSRRHGGDTPLVDTGTLRASVSFEIE